MRVCTYRHIRIQCFEQYTKAYFVTFPYVGIIQIKYGNPDGRRRSGQHSPFSARFAQAPSVIILNFIFKQSAVRFVHANAQNFVFGNCRSIIKRRRRIFYRISVCDNSLKVYSAHFINFDNLNFYFVAYGNNVLNLLNAFSVKL